MLSCLFGCAQKNNRFDTDLFCCTYNEDKTGVIILELTEKGQEQEILVIPEEINGLPVVQLGGTTMGYPYQSSSTLRSSKVKKVYFKTKKENIAGGFTNFQNSRNVDFVIISPLNDCFYFLGLFSAGGYVDGKYLPNSFYGNIDQETFVSESHNVEVKKSNVIFYDSCDGEVYWLDEIKLGAVYVTPESPCKDGFVFDGWYTEEECTIKWDGQYVLSDGKETLNLYAKWVEK